MRILIAILLIVFLALQYRLWLSDDGLRKVWHRRDLIAQRTEQNSRLAQRNAELAAEVHDLKHGLAAVGARARTELGLVKPEESFYEIVTPDEDSYGDDKGAGELPLREAGLPEYSGEQRSRFGSASSE